jgi:UDP-glucose 4-epimerase
MAKVLVAGGAGFIGSHLCEALLDRGHQVVAIDNFHLGKAENMASFRSHPSFKFLEGDILDEAFLAGIFDAHAFEAVFHLAANSDIRASLLDLSLDYNLTFATTHRLLCECHRKKVKQFIFASSSAVFGETSDVLHEGYGPLKPVSLYGAAKLASEGFISAFAHSLGMQAWIFRFPNVVGGRATHGVIYDFIEKLRANPHELEVLGNGQQNKPYMYVKELVDGILFGWEKSGETYNVFMLGVPSRTTVAEIAHIVIEEMGLKAVIRYTGGDGGWVGDVPEFRYDTACINNLGWKPRRSSTEAVRTAIRCIVSQ